MENQITQTSSPLVINPPSRHHYSISRTIILHSSRSQSNNNAHYDWMYLYNC